ncbi:uncharacterized protein LOC119730867 [Patiria miniata]|uniref:Uncharacterized protein n=1 Tax=Patiria miniata TaxID=46514 RepID=A0A914A8W8_PATMI|nr:uncharacterized protein LOC119730867 [Patiria miniata]
MVGVPAVGLQWVELQTVLLFTTANACFALTTPAPTESTGILGLSSDVILWIIIGTASLFVVTCVCIITLLCVIARKERAAKRTFTPAVIQAVHGDAIRGIGPSRPVIDTEQQDSRAVQTPQSTAGDGDGDAVVTSPTHESIELEQLGQRQQPNGTQ